MLTRLHLYLLVSFIGMNAIAPASSIVPSGNCVVPSGNCVVPSGNCVVPSGNCVVPSGNCVVLSGNCTVLPAAATTLQTAREAGSGTRAQAAREAGSGTELQLTREAGSGTGAQAAREAGSGVTLHVTREAGSGTRVQVAPDSGRSTAPQFVSSAVANTAPQLIPYAVTDIGPQLFSSAVADIGPQLIPSVVADTGPHLVRDAVTWQPSLEAARAEARRTNRLVMVEFFADWCVYCQALDNDVLPSRIVQDQLSQFVPLRLNSEREGAPLMDQYDPTGAIPFILFMDADGSAIDQIPGAESARDFAADLKRIAASYREFPSLEDRVRRFPNDIDAAVRYAVGLTQRGRVGDAEKLIASLEARSDDLRPQLVLVYDRLGNYYLTHHRVSDARIWYEKIVAAAQSGRDLALAHFKLGLAAVLEHQHEDAVAELNAVLRTEGAPDALKERAREVLNQIQDDSLGGGIPIPLDPTNPDTSGAPPAETTPAPQG